VDTGRPIQDRTPGGTIPLVDGLTTSVAGVGLLGLTADCPIVVVFDPRRRVAGVAHAGWRGTVGGITTCLILRLVNEYGARPSDMVATMAPSAGPCCYEVREDVVSAARVEDPGFEQFFQHRDGRTWMDLWSFNEDQLVRCGVGRGRIERPGRCTICDERFYSYRRLGARTGHSGVLVAIRP
jgi:hypothetical protein